MGSKDEKEDVPLTLQQLNKHAKLMEGELTLDYDLYQKIKF